MVTKVGAIKGVMKNNGGKATLQDIYSLSGLYYPNVDAAKDWKAGLRGVLYREICVSLVNLTTVSVRHLLGPRPLAWHSGAGIPPQKAARFRCSSFRRAAVGVLSGKTAIASLNDAYRLKK